MIVGDDQPVRRDDEAGAVAAISCPLGANPLDAADGRADAIDHVGDGGRVGVKQRGIIRADVLVDIAHCRDPS